MRNLDHFVMPVADLASARARFTALGFNVAPNARHPFGTENCCIFFGDTTFIEPLAIGNPESYQTAVAAENAFVTGHLTYTAKHGPEGFSHLVVKSTNAREDHASFEQAGVSAAGIVDFGRTFTKPDGTTGEVAFSLAFAKPNAPSNAAFFACEVVKAVSGGRGTLVNHTNGALATKRVTLLADEPGEYAAFFQHFLGVESRLIQNGISFLTKTGSVELTTKRVLQPENSTIFKSSLALQALVLQVASLAETRQLLAQNSIAVHDQLNRIIVPPAPGQGATLIFEE